MNRRVVHFCHWPDCREQVPPKLWGCRHHWFALPKSIRDAIWRAYVPGQEVTKTPSAAYIAAARAAQDWIAGRALPAPSTPPVRHFNETKADHE